MQYVVVYEQTANGWSASVPDLPGCVATGDTRAEVEALMRVAIPRHIHELRKAKEPVPLPGSFTGIVEV